jgi:tetratricopeptide (TPR) repeat protein
MTRNYYITAIYKKNSNNVMEKKMTRLKTLISFLVLAMLLACGGTKGDETDYSQITDVELFAMANKDMDQGHYERAIDNYNRILLDFPVSNLHIDCQLKIAEAYGRLDNFEEQMARLHRLVKENIVPERVPKIYIQIGKFYERAALFNPGIITSDSVDYVHAIDYYDQALKYPDSDDNRSKSEAVYRRALVEAKIGQIQEAVSRYKLVSSLFPKSDFSILAQIKLKDPSNVNELATTDSAMTSYKQTLGLVEGQEADEQVTDKPVSEEVQQQEQDGNLNETFKFEENSEGTSDDSINDDGNIEAPAQDNTNMPEEMPTEPAESDTTGS